MPYYAPFGNAIFGQTKFGPPPNVSVGTTITVSPSGYGTLNLSWPLPGTPTTWNEMVLVRSSSGVPSSIYEGVILFDSSSAPFPSNYVDNNLVPGKFYYYALFVKSTVLNQYVLSASALGLVVTNYGFVNNFTRWIPDWYLTMDAALITAQQPQGPLTRLLGLLGYEADWIRSEIESLFTLNNVDAIVGSLLPYLGANLGMAYESSLGMTRSRVLVKNAVNLYKERGTAIGIAAAASAYSGYGAKVTTGAYNVTAAPYYNLMIQLDDAAFDSSTGHWVPGNGLSNIALYPIYPANTPNQYDYSVNQTTPSMDAAEHFSYNPVPALFSSAIDGNTIAGYLPANNKNVAVISAGSKAAVANWQLYAPNSALRIANRTGAAMGNLVTTSATSTTITSLFGGQSTSSSKTFYGDLYTWNNTASGWTSSVPAAPITPSGRDSAAMVYDPVNNVYVLFGGVDVNGNYLGDTWVYLSGSWSQLTFTGATPSARTGTALAWDPTGTGNSSAGAVLLYGGLSAAGLPTDTWKLIKSGGVWSWVLLTPANGAFPNYNGTGIAYHTMTQSGSSGVVMYGGLSGFTVQSGTWVWTTTNGWNYITQVAGQFPPGRFQHSAAYSAGTNSGAIVFGGSAGGGTTYSDTWLYTWSTYSTGFWTPFTYSGSTTPPPVSQAALFSVGSGLFILYGGLNPTFGELSSTYLFTTATSAWTQLSPSSTAGPLSNMAYASNATSTSGYLFGGDYNNSGTASPTMYNFNYGTPTWSAVTYTNSPAVRANAVLGGANTGTLVLYGGQNNTGYLSDYWVYTYATNTWSAGVSGSPGYRINAASVTVGTMLYVFGGQNASGTYLNDLWAYNGSTWFQISTTATPSARAGASLATDGTNIWLFGGYNSTVSTNQGYYNDFYKLAGTAWSTISATGPSARENSAFMYDFYTAQFTLFGGYGLATVSGVSAPAKLNDTWAFTTGTNAWSQLTVTAPRTSSYPLVAYNPTLQGGVLFLGDTATKDASTYTYQSGPLTGQMVLTTCSSANGTTLGIPIQGIPLDLESATPFEPTTVYVFSAYFKQLPQATVWPLATFTLQFDWYGLNGVFIRSTATPATVTEGTTSWVRGYVADSPPFGAYSFGVTIKSEAQFTGDQHLMDACQIEVSVAATPTPTAWQPPRDLKVNLIPVRQNLVSDPVALGGLYKWTITTGTCVSTYSLATPPALAYPSQITSAFKCTAASNAINISTVALVNGGSSYALSLYALAATSLRTVTVTLTFDQLATPVVYTTTFTETNNGAATPTNLFTRGSLLVTKAPSGATHATITISMTGLTNGEVHYFTGVMLEPAAGVNPYFDGNFSPSFDYRFEGTPNQSVSDYYPAMQTKLTRLAEILPAYIPIGSTFSLYTGANVWGNLNLYTGTL